MSATAPDKASNWTASDIDQLCINTIRTLSMDAVQAANSGHPGTPVALAPVAYTLWQRFLRFDPSDPIWPNRDRFVLSAGHASMLLYSLLHLSGTKSVQGDSQVVNTPAVSLDDIKRFRQIDSKTPGHPEYHWTSGVETTTGPLGQGVANSVGMAMAGKWLGARYNRPGFELFDFNVYAICGDGDLMEGASSETASVAGHLKLANLCWIYDNNRITIEGSTDLAFSEDVATRFIAAGWNVTRVTDANDTAMLARAFEVFQNEQHRPTLIIVDSHIGFGTKKQDSHTAHGEPLGEDVIADFKQRFGLSAEKFVVPAGVYEQFAAGVGHRGAELSKSWADTFASYKAQFPQEAKDLELMQRRELPQGWDQSLPTFPADPKGQAGRAASSTVQQVIAKNVPWLIGGAADLAPSTKTIIEDKAAGHFQADNYAGRNFHFGVREMAMASILNGMALTMVRPYGAGFFIFSDFSRPAIRLAAIMELPVLYIFTHDSIGVGEDGPTHQPIEQLASLRAIPNLLNFRPGDANEIVEAWKVILPLKHEPACLILTRQNVPTLDRSKYAPASGLARGAYVLADAEGGTPEVILMASGSEVPLIVDAYEQLKAEGIRARVVSMPCWELFERQDRAYQDSVLPPEVTARVSVEQASTFGWERYTGRDGARIGMHTFGASAPLKELQKKFGFEPARVVAAAREQLARVRQGR